MDKKTTVFTGASGGKANYKNYKVYFLGIGGISMSALAVYLKNRGFCVGGFDKEKNDCVVRLKKSGIKTDVENKNFGLKSVENESDCSLRNIPDGLKNSDAVIYSSAISESDPMLVYALNGGKAVMSRAELLAEIIKNYKFSFGVGGTHGKTTATLMLCHILKNEKINFDAHIGGGDNTFENFYFGSKHNECIISEVCEYKRNISLFSPTVAVVLNVDNDHLESYGSFSALADEFVNFALRGKFFVYNADDKTLAKRFLNKIGADTKAEGVSFSIKNENCDYCAKNIKKCGTKIKFKVLERKKLLGEFEINGVFKHNVLNALAAICAARLYGVGTEAIKRGLEEYAGAYRREEILGEYSGATVFADYCHHPKQIKETINALEKSKAQNVIIVFQPHTFSRTKILFKRFLTALKTKRAKLIITGVYAARESYDYIGSGKRLAENIENAVFIKDCDDAVKYAFGIARGGDTVAFLGAGDVYFKAKEFVDKNKK